MKCDVCLKDEKFCTCVGAEKKHVKHLQKVEDKKPLSPDLLPDQSSHTFDIPLADDEDKEDSDISIGIESEDVGVKHKRKGVVASIQKKIHFGNRKK